jgi:hypothetical protein
MIQNRLSHHILPNASTMLGVCPTGIGLVKIAEAYLGPSRVDEYLAQPAFFSLAASVPMRPSEARAPIPESQIGSNASPTFAL